ncbi:hypothetical protein LCGC14_1357850 [marine sediment metagenome]|uniref:Uncharacterized protein n=1 Tax=marine sediment metagenome TaxID=412755 RepID=A0A0F9MPD1_9ZZZZ
MAVEILVAAKNLNHSLKGYPKNAKDTPCVWGTKERPPDYVILRLTDATKVQVEHYLQQWHKKFAYDIINENASGYRIKVKVDPALVSVSNVNKAVRAEMKKYIQDTFGASIFSYDACEAVVDVLKPITRDKGTEWEKILTLRELKNDIHDKFADVIDHRHYYFSNSDVDYALTQPGGIVERTKAQVLAMIKNKLDE